MSRCDVPCRAALLALVFGSSVGCGGGGATGAPTDQGGDAATPDAGTRRDSGASDEDCVPFVMPKAESCAPPADGPLPKDLRCTGLYGDFEQRTLACGVVAYKPAHELWSDGAEKHRFVALPPGTKVDTSDPDAFVYPDGTKFWKEFRVDDARGKSRLAETRLLQKTPDGWLYTSYVWSADGQRATQMDNMLGVPSLDDTGHTVPTRDQCADCHKGRTDYVLGWDAIMLGPGAEGVTRENIVALGLATAAPPALSIPGTAVERAALGYMHANCGISCHNETIEAPARDTSLYLRLERGELGRVQTTDAFKSINKRPADNAKYEGLANRSPANWYDIRPGDPARSLMIARQELRGFEGQMPRIGTNKVDPQGVEVVRAWIESMTPENGYPAAEP